MSSGRKVLEPIPGSRHDRESGSVLLMAVLVLTLLTGMGLALLSLGGSEIAMAQATVRSKQTFFLAEAGVEDGRMTLFAVNGQGSFDDDLKRVAGDDEEIDFDPDDLVPIYDDDGNLTGLTGYDDDVPLRALTSLELDNGARGWYAAFLTNDPTEDHVGNGTNDTDDRIMLTGVGAGPHGSLEIVQAIVQSGALTVPPPPPAAITMLGGNPIFRGGNKAFYTGEDCDGKGDKSILVPAIGVFDDAAESTVEDGREKGKYKTKHYRDRATIVNLNDPDEPLSGPTDPTWTECLALRALMSDLRAHADVVCRPGACLLPSESPDRIIYAEGNFTGLDGEGILAVTGRLKVRNDWDWRGLVLVVGQGEMIRDGDHRGAIHGAVVLANISGPDKTLFTEDDCKTGLDGFGSARFETTRGEETTVSYCSTTIEAANPPQPYSIVGFRQR